MTKSTSHAGVVITPAIGKGKERKGKERKGKERKGFLAINTGAS